MKEINEFLAKNYLYFIIASGVLIALLILSIIIPKIFKKSSKKEVLETIKLDPNTLNASIDNQNNINNY